MCLWKVMAPDQGSQRSPAPASRWLALFVVARAGATAVAVALLLLHDVTGTDRVLAPVAGVYGVVTVLLALRVPRLRTARAAWAADIVGTLGLVLATGDWRTPCYLLFVTSLIGPATSLRLGRAAALGAAASLLYAGAAVVTGLDIERLESTPRLESLATHLAVPLLVSSALAYAAGLLARLESERRRSELLAVEAERRRIAWELHDSAKQRLGVAHLLLSSLERPNDAAGARALDQALAELSHAGTDLETSVSELGAPGLEGRSLRDALRDRASELQAASPARIEVRGEAGPMPPMIATHAFRIAGEALTNAVRHAHARHIVVDLNGTPTRLRLRVADDGRGLPARPRPGANGLRSMRHRAAGIGARLDFAPAGNGEQPGTSVTLEVPLTASQGDDQ
jgi:two-component system sensor histidine kinase UhpB